MNKKQMIMKKLFIVLVVGLMWAACTREEVVVFSLEVIIYIFPMITEQLWLQAWF